MTTKTPLTKEALLVLENVATATKTWVHQKDRWDFAAKQIAEFAALDVTPGQCEQEAKSRGWA